MNSSFDTVSTHEAIAVVAQCDLRLDHIPLVFLAKF